MKRRKQQKKQHAQNLKPLSGYIANIVGYWQKSLIDSKRMNISGASIRSMGSRLAFADVVNGQCSRTNLKELKEKFEAQNTSRNKARNQSQKFQNEVSENIPVVICPLRFRKQDDENVQLEQMPPYLDVFWVPAQLTPDGTLVPPVEPLPWIPRDFLAPNISDEVITIGSLKKFNKYIAERPLPRGMSWSEYWQACRELFKASCGTDLTKLSIPDYDHLKDAAIILDTSSPGSSRHARRVYSQLLYGQRKPGLLAQIAREKIKERRENKFSNSSFTKQAESHLGQFEHRFPLSYSQRQAVHCFSKIGEEGVLTVNGPPGTGKTTLLQSIIASLWVKKALQGKEPPIILACAGTNQAVTNIIDSFAKAKGSNSPLSGHWLPGVSSYGTYCPSATSAKNFSDSKIHLECTDGEGLSKNMESFLYIEDAKKHYLAKVSEVSGQNLSLKQAIAYFRKGLQREALQIKNDLFNFRFGDTIGFLKSCLGLLPEIPADDLLHENQALDCSRRHHCFLLATHYWEGRWLLKAQGEVSEMETRSKKQRRQRMKNSFEHWQRRAMITPCFVSTVNMAASFFGETKEDGSPMLDLLIIDEAGQVQPEVGAACFALTKKALVVGDTKQLAPYWNTPPHIDQFNLENFKLVKNDNEKQLQQIEKRGLAASSGNMMLLAQTACPLIDNSTIGVFLTEHRRSVPQIISYCNALCYGGRLIPKRPPLKKRVLPAFGYAHVAGSQERVGPSWANKDEAEVIAQWIRKCSPGLKRFYQGQDFERDIIAVLTPFTAQKKALEDAIHKDFPNLKIGTVNSMQGAERRIIIFSPVYDSSHTLGYHFDRSTQLLNVAVSRAQDSFLTFADMGIFQQNNQTPSGLLARFLFRREHNELRNVEPLKRKGFEADKVVRLTSLAQHRTALAESLERAQKEIIIISPQISSIAMEYDSVPELVSKAVARGVSVKVYTDANLDVDDDTNTLREFPQKGRRALVQAGAELNIADGIHNKSIYIDEREMFEGSFNWLSAVRNVNSKYHREEISFHYVGKQAKEEIEKTKQVLDFRMNK